MSEMQTKAISMISEIDRVCHKENIKYFVGPKTLLWMQKHVNDKNWYNFDILVPTEEIENFIKAINRNLNDVYEIESMVNNENYPGFTLRCVDPSTTVITFAKGTDIMCPGLAIEIIPIRKYQKNKKIKLVNFLERGWESNGFKLTSNMNAKHQLGAKIIKSYYSILGKKNVSKKLFRVLVQSNAGAIGSKRVSIRLHKRHEKVVRGRYFAKSERVELRSGVYVDVPAIREEFLNEYFGIVWKTQDVIGNALPEIALSNVPYSEFIVGCKDNDIDLKHFFEVKKANIISLLAIRNHTAKKRESVYIARRSGARLHLYEQLKPVMPEIQAAYEAHDVKKLRVLLAENEKETLLYLGKNLGLCVNELCLKAQALVFEKTGRKDLADKLIRLAPVEHYKSIIE